MKKRVLSKKENGEQETPLDAYKRVAKFVAASHAKFSPNEVKKFEDKVIDMLSNGKFMPNTPTLVNAGFPNAQCSACFVIPIEDNIQSIYRAHYNQGLIQSSGGGFGAYFGNIRSAGTLAANRFVTKGPVSWLKMFNENAGHVVQGMREGANMAVLDIGHPDIVEFIKCKQAGYNVSIEALAEQFSVSIEEAKRIRSIIGIEKFNISVSISDKFMETLNRGGDWYLIDPHTQQRVKSIPADELWRMIAESAHLHGEPGIIFIDEINRHNSLSHISRIEATNPCGEEPLVSYGSCTLGHVNLGKFVVGDNGASKVNWDGLEDAIRFSTQFLDDIVEINHLPIPELIEMNKNSRQIGVGIMGWADALIKMKIPYDSDEAVQKIHEIGKFFDSISLDESQKLGKDRGNFPYFEGSPLQESGIKYLRNANRTTIAPTGQTSMYAGCSSGIEPILFPVMQREQAGMIQVDYHPILLNTLKVRGLDSKEIVDKLGTLGSVRKATFLPQDIREVFPSSHDIHYTWHIKHQAAWQQYITAAVSKTINLPATASVDDIDQVYKTAHHMGCKGITVYRDGSRMNQPISSLKTSRPKNKRSEVTHGTNRKIPCGCGNLMLYVGGSDGKIEEITARLGKGGGCAASVNEATARLVSVALQHGVDVHTIIKQLSGIRCHLSALYRSKYTGDKPRTITSCADAISVAIEEHIINGSNQKISSPKSTNHSGACPECGGQLFYVEGCCKCTCGFSRC